MNTKEDDIMGCAEQVRDKIFSSYGYFGLLEKNNTVSIPREGDWIKWIADAIYIQNQSLIAENNRLREEIKQAIPAMREFARKNQQHKHNGMMQDPCGVHDWLNRNQD